MNKGGVKSPTQITAVNSCRHSPLKEVELKTLPVERELHFVRLPRAQCRQDSRRGALRCRNGRHSLSRMIRIKVTRGKLCPCRGLLIGCGESNISSL